MLYNLFTFAVIEKFETFSFYHLAAMALVFVFWTGTIIIVRYINKKTNKTDNNLFRYIFALLLIISELSNTVWHVLTGHFSITDSLPLQLCGIAVFTCSLMLITKNYRLFEFNYFAGIGGALQAIITPDITRNFPHFEFIQLFLAHALIILSVLYMIFINKYLPAWKSLIRALIATNICMGIIYIFNIFSGANYMYVNHQPDFPSIIDILVDLFGTHPWYIIGLELIAFIVFIILLIPVCIYEHYNKKILLS